MFLVALLICFAFSAMPVQARDDITDRPEMGDFDVDGWWLKDHYSKMIDKMALSPIDWIMVGDGITQGWETAGKDAMEKQFSGRSILNLGTKGDMTQQVLWRLGSGEVFNVSPKLITLMIGMENIVSPRSMRRYRPPAIHRGISVVIDDLEKRCPNSKIVVLSILPLGATKDDPLRKKVDEINRGIPGLIKGKKNVTYLDISGKFLDANGVLSKSIMPDLKHPNAKGYEVWAKAISPTVEKILGPASKKHVANTPATRDHGHHRNDVA